MIVAFLFPNVIGTIVKPTITLFLKDEKQKEILGEKRQNHKLTKICGYRKKRDTGKRKNYNSMSFFIVMKGRHLIFYSN